MNSRTKKPLVCQTHKQQRLQECVPGKVVQVARGSGSAGSAGPSARAQARPRGESASLLKQTIIKANYRVVILMRGVRVSGARADSPVRRTRAGKTCISQRNNHTERMNETYSGSFQTTERGSFRLTAKGAGYLRHVTTRELPRTRDVYVLS